MTRNTCLTVKQVAGYLHLHEKLLKEMQTSQSHQIVHNYQGYNPARCGELLWGGD